MSNKRITDLTELTNPTTDDVFPVVDIATNTTTKVQLANLPVQTAVTTALATKENTITSGTTAQYFRGDKSFQTLDKTAVGLANVDNTSDANKPVSTAQQTALNAKQDTLVSGTNIKTINGTSLLGSGNIPVVTSPSGVAGAIQFSNGSAFASDASNLFWDDTNNRLGVGTNAPTATGHFKGSGSTSATTSLLVQNSGGGHLFSVRDDGRISMGNNNVFGYLYSNITGANFPSYSFDGNPQVGMFNISTGNFGLSAGGVERMRIGTGGIGINTLASNVASATLQIDSTTQGVLFPRMTTTQKNAIATPAAGLVVYDSTTNKLCCYNGSTWNDLF
jgi:hypothetical protein